MIDDILYIHIPKTLCHKTFVVQATTAREPDLILIGALGILCNGGSRWTIQFGVCAKQRAIAGIDTANPTMIIAGSEGSFQVQSIVGFM